MRTILLDSQPGDEYYLNLINATGLSAAIDALLNAVPPAPVRPTTSSSGDDRTGWTVGETVHQSLRQTAG